MNLIDFEERFSEERRANLENVWVSQIIGTNIIVKFLWACGAMESYLIPINYALIDYKILDNLLFKYGILCTWRIRRGIYEHILYRVGDSI